VVAVIAKMQEGGPVTSMSMQNQRIYDGRYNYAMKQRKDKVKGLIWYLKH
jgi:hypothetical protein